MARRSITARGGGTDTYELHAPSTVVVLLSQDSQLVEALPQGLIDINPSIEVQVVRNSESLAHHLEHLHPDAMVIDMDSVAGDELPELLRAGPAARVPTIVIDSQQAELGESRAIAHGAASYVARSQHEWVERVGEEVIRTRRVATMASEETQAHYHNILEASSDGIFVVVDGVFSYVNGSFVAALETAHEDLVGRRPLIDLVVPEERREVSQALARVAVSDGRTQLIEMTLQGRYQRTVFQVSCRASVVDGKRAVVGVARDVTERRKLEAELERARQRAAQVERMRALGELAAGVAHDFNNTLGTIIGRVELALDKLGRGQPLVEELSVIERAARDAAATVQRIQSFSRPDGDDTWEDVDLRAVVAEAAQFARTRVPPGVAFEIDLHPTPIIRGSGAELREVLSNLINNAIDAVEPGGNVVISCGDDGGNAVIVVEDNGHGMPPEVQKRIFEPFFSTKGAGKGTGLGLSVSHWILRRHDAQIQLQSEPGKGTRFRLIFSPFEPAERHPPRLAAKESLTVLVVDDDRTVGEMVSDLLTDQGHTVTVVGNAAGARAALGERDIELVITDLDLPDVSGWQLARELRKQAPNLVVGLISGWPLGVSQDELRARGVDFVLTKPFSIDALHEAVERVRNAEEHGQGLGKRP